MSSSKAEAEQQCVAEMVRDTDPALVREPRLLSDPRFLGILHFEMSQKVGPAEAAGALLQLGFLRGLRDAASVMRHGFLADSQVHDGSPHSPLLATRFGVTTQGSVPGRIEIQGSWPDRPEAEARLSTMGPSPDPVCYVSAGYTSGWLSGIREADFLAMETDCSAGSAEECRFVAREADSWRELGDARAAELLRFLPFDELRAAVDREYHAAELPSEFEEGGTEAPVVHVWGPVMIVPFSGADESVRAVELIGSDPEAREVSVVIVDLGGVVLDEAFGALALERTLDAIESWGAEPILTGVSLQAEAVVLDLERNHLMVRKDFPEAIATAFQVVEAQRNLL